MSDAGGRAVELAPRTGRLFRPTSDVGMVGAAAAASPRTNAGPGASGGTRPTNASAAGFGGTIEVGAESSGAAAGCVEAAAIFAWTLPSRRTNTSPAPSKTEATTPRKRNTPLARSRIATWDGSRDLWLIVEGEEQGPFL